MTRYGECRTIPECLPTEQEIRDAAQAEHAHFLIASWGRDQPETLSDVFLQRLELPMEVFSPRAGMDITLPDLASVHRWAATEFEQYEMGRL